MKFNRYKRGSIVMVNFSPSMGSEISGKHLAIVLTKNDSPSNSVLTVIPLSSKEKPYYLPLGNFLLSVIVPKLENLVDSIPDISKELTPKEVKDIKNNLLELHSLVKTYSKMNVNSYALVQNISTISKLRILKPLNKYDPIGKIIIPNTLLDKIDDEIINLFIGKLKS